MRVTRSLAVTLTLIGADARGQPSDAETTDSVVEPEPQSDPGATRDPDDYIDPGELPPPEVLHEPPYPRSLVKRPLLMRAGGIEASVAAGFGRESIADMAPVTYGALFTDIRSGRGFAELDIGGRFVPVHRDTQESTFEVPGVQRLYAAAKLRLTNDTTVGALAELRAPGSDLVGYSPSLILQHKLRPSERGAIVVGARAAYVAQHEPLFNGYTAATTSVIGVGVLTAQLQLTPNTAIEASGIAGAYRYLDDGHPGRRSGFGVAYSGGFVIALNNDIDLDPFIVSVGSLNNLAGFVAGLSLVFH